MFKSGLFFIAFFLLLSIATTFAEEAGNSLKLRVAQKLEEVQAKDTIEDNTNENDDDDENDEESEEQENFVLMGSKASKVLDDTEEDNASDDSNENNNDNALVQLMKKKNNSHGKPNQKACLIPARKWYHDIPRFEPVLVSAVDTEYCFTGTLGARVPSPYGETICPSTEGPQFAYFWTVRFPYGSDYTWQFSLYSQSPKFNDTDLTLQLFNCEHQDILSYCNPGISEAKVNTIFKDTSYIMVISTNNPSQTGDFEICMSALYPY